MRQINLALIPVFFFFACGSRSGSKSNQLPDKISQSVGCAIPRTSDKDWYTSGKKAPLFEGLGGIDFNISTSVKEAQVYFNQGMMFSYGFNHAEAARSFFEATRLDSTCAMAYWGFAYVLGPNYNGGMEEDNFERAYVAAAKAQSLSAKCTPKEIALIGALTARYAQQPPADRSSLDVAYAAAMKKVYAQYPSDPDIGALYAEALMDLHPWDLYDKKTKAPKAWTPGLVEILERLMKEHPKHPGAHHFYIHALEASATPEKAITSARVLDTLVPGAGHLLHMSSHIYINTGDYHLGSLSNIRAVEEDSVYTTACHAQGAYPLAYFPHNYHFLAATATLEGNSALAWESAKKLQEHTSEEIMRMPGWGTLQHYYTIPYYIAVKLSMWDTIAALPAPGKDLVYPRAIWHYAKGMAFLGKHDIADAQKEMDSLGLLAADTILQDLTIWNINTTADLVQIASKVLSAGIALQQGKTDQAVSMLREAVVMEDNLNYNEPPDWFFSVRHHLGAVLLKAGKYKEAEEVYRRDLQTWRKNGWALIGLSNALTMQNKKDEAQKARVAFDEAWKYADVKISSSSGITD
ncbi:tetratricopeptide repeat protein [Chitinophaga barathri]|uniref:Tetratricopeptide repeat protein n=1 Tax=Chitinophaga barathri TaxID=1647451 RepID=A0A3N4M4E3_9BACT|nr:tetratricopeptide repeat protein [Chitinophaga barathri]RPD37922.1 tetratricopeptide repeat protein [Chitinophaga barathri]